MKISRIGRNDRRESRIGMKEKQEENREKSRRKSKRKAKVLWNRIMLIVNLILFIVLVTLVIKNVKKYHHLQKQTGRQEERIGEERRYADGYIDIFEEKGQGQEQEPVVGVSVSKENLTKFKELCGKGHQADTGLTVCLDAGHGGSDTGAESIEGVYEKTQNLELALMVEQYLESIQINVTMTRTKDETLSLERRRQIAEESHADLFVSIHRNVYEGEEDINGIEAWINSSEPQEAKNIAEGILRNMKQSITGLYNRGIKCGTMDNPYEDYAVNKVSMTSMILEVGFISSNYDNRIFQNYEEELAFAIAQGIAQNICG